jgi:hypothetical protein
MQDHENAVPTSPKRTPWNKRKLIGPKPPLRPKHVWSIRTKLQIEGRTRDLAMFNLAIDSKLRGCNVVALNVEDVAPRGYAVDRATVRQKKTGHLVRFELTEQTRQAIGDYVRAAGKRSGEFLFLGRRGPERCMTTRQYARLVSWELIRVGEHLVGVNTGHSNQLAAEAVAAGRIPELRGYPTLRREVGYGRASRVDPLLEAPGRPICYVEAKNVTLRRGRLAEFPDCVTKRGSKHLAEVAAMARDGHRAVMRMSCSAAAAPVSASPPTSIPPMTPPSKRRGRRGSRHCATIAGLIRSG